MGKRFVCARCGGRFVSEQTDEQAYLEMNKLFGPKLDPSEPHEVICDDCFTAFREWFDALTPEQRAKIEQGRRDEYNIKEH